jgi:tetratricopeptide (TPR) repeat protein
MKDNRQEPIQGAENEKKNLQVGEVIGKTEMFIENNKRTLLIVVGAIVVVIVAFCLYKFWYMPSQEKKAENELFAAQQYFAQEDYTKALKGDGKHQGLIAISEDYSSTKQGKLAKYYIGIIYLQQGKYQDAIDNFEDFNPDDAFLVSQSKALIGDCYWELNSVDKAISYYTKAIKKNPNNFTTPVVLMKLGIAYESQKDYQKALDCYNQIKTDFPRSPEYAEIQKYITHVEELMGK